MNANDEMVKALTVLTSGDAAYVENEIRITCASHGDAIRIMREARSALAKFHETADRRAHHEAQIKRFDTGRNGEFGTAIRELVLRHKLNWFTDKQIADIRDVMMRTEFRRQKDAARSRAHFAALRTA